MNGGKGQTGGKESQQYFVLTDCIYNLRPISPLASMSNLQISSNSLQTQILIIFEAAVAGRPVSVSGFFIFTSFIILLNLHSWVGGLNPGYSQSS
jgi:hypothetical protein